MLIGIPPFSGTSQRELIHKIRERKISFPCKDKYEIEYSDEIVDLI